MRVAAAAYPLDPLTSWDAFEAKITAWVTNGVAESAELLVFPEYGAMELAMLEGAMVAGELEASLWAVAAHMPRANAVLAKLAQEHGVHILGASAPVKGPTDRPVNRATLFGPTGEIGSQDKQVMTRFERETWDVVSGAPLQIFDIGIAKIGILICYDAEFPLLGRRLIEAGADLILTPSCTDALAGYWRVRIGAMARALEGQCVVVHSPTVGPAPWSPAVDENVGAAAIYGPPDIGFPPTGVIAEGALNQPGWVTADIDLDAIGLVRREGRVLNLKHWEESRNRV